jgi:hypothetical protein
MAEDKQSKGRVRRWLDRRRDAQRRGAEMTQRTKAARKGDLESARRRGGSGGPPVGGI